MQWCQNIAARASPTARNFVIFGGDNFDLPGPSTVMFPKPSLYFLTALFWLMQFHVLARGIKEVTRLTVTVKPFEQVPVVVMCTDRSMDGWFLTL